MRKNLRVISLIFWGLWLSCSFLSFAQFSPPPADPEVARQCNEADAFYLKADRGGETLSRSLTDNLISQKKGLSDKEILERIEREVKGEEEKKERKIDIFVLQDRGRNLPLADHKSLCGAALSGKTPLAATELFSVYLLRSVLDKKPTDAYSELIIGQLAIENQEQKGKKTERLEAEKNAHQRAINRLIEVGIPVDKQTILSVTTSRIAADADLSKSDTWNWFEERSKAFVSPATKCPDRQYYLTYACEESQVTELGDFIYGPPSRFVQEQIEKIGSTMVLQEALAEWRQKTQPKEVQNAYQNLQLGLTLLIVDPQDSHLDKDLLRQAVLASGPDPLKMKCVAYARRLLWDKVQSKEPEKLFKETYAAWKQLGTKTVYGLSLDTQAELEKNLESVGYQWLLVRLIQQYPLDCVKWFKEVFDENAGKLEKESQEFFWLGFTSAYDGQGIYSVPKEMDQAALAVEPYVPDALIKVEKVRDRLIERR